MAVASYVVRNHLKETITYGICAYLIRQEGQDVAHKGETKETKGDFQSIGPLG